MRLCIVSRPGHDAGVGTAVRAGFCACEVSSSEDGAADGVGVECREGLASAGFVTAVSVIFLVVCFLVGVFAPR